MESVMTTHGFIFRLSSSFTIRLELWLMTKYTFTASVSSHPQWETVYLPNINMNTWMKDSVESRCDWPPKT